MKKLKQVKTRNKDWLATVIDKCQQFTYQFDDHVDRVDDWIDLKLKRQNQTIVKSNSLIKVYLLVNVPTNEIDSKIFDQLRLTLKNDLSQDSNIKLSATIESADLVIFSISEHLSLNAIRYLSNIDIPKIGIVTSASASFDFSKMKNLTIVSQFVDNELSDKHLLSMFNVRDGQLKKIILSYLLDTARDPDITNVYEVRYHQTLFEFGLLALMAYALPARYSHLIIKCENEDQAKVVAKAIKTDTSNISNVNNTVAICVNEPRSSYSEAVKSHGEMSMLKLMRRVVESRG